MKMTKRILAFICTILLLFLGSIPAAADADSAPVVRVGYMLLAGFEEGERGEIKSGYGYEYLQMLRNYTGWTYEYVYGTRDELLGMLARGEIDMLSHVARTPEREKQMLFSLEPQGDAPHYLYVCVGDTHISANDSTTISGKTIGVLRGDHRRYYFERWCSAQEVACHVREYDDVEMMHEDLHNGRIDAVACGSESVAEYPGEWHSLIRFEDVPVYVAVSRNRPDLLAEIDQAQASILSIDPYYGETLMQKHMGMLAPTTPALSDEETEWLHDRGTLTVGYCVDRRPLAFTDENGALSGILSDYLNVMAETFGIVFEPRPYPDGITLLQALKTGEVDIIAPVGYTYGMAEQSGVSVTNSLTAETMLAVFKGYEGTERKDIYRRIAVLRNSVTDKDYARRNYPDAVLVDADTIADAIEFVEAGIADCYMIRSSSYAWYKGEYELLGKLQIATLPETCNVNMAIRTEDLDLLPILNRGISLLDDTDITAAIVAYAEAREPVTWLTVMRDNPVATAIGILAITFFVGVIFLTYRLRTDKTYLRQLEAAKAEADAARAEAEQASRAKSTFLTSMSHDIRTPMNAIIGMTTLAAKHIENPEYVRGCLSKVTLASDHLLTLINDVLDINKIETGRLSLNPTVFSIADSIMNLANIGRHQLREKEHHFEIRVHNVRQEYLFADELRINQVFINLLSNAVKYTPAGGRITIDIAEEPVPGEREKVRLIYTVEDNGIGMSEAFQAHMYELFAMADRTGNVVSGSGVGLAICRQLVDLMKGRIECVSAPDRGTKFTVTLELPIADRVTDSLMLPPMRMLLVDDDEVFLATASDTLRELGLSPDCVDSGEKAVAAVTAQHQAERDYPLIIIDWKMPGMDGIETTRAIRRIVGDEVSIIVISAYAPEDIGEAARAAGANGYISKPFFRSNVYANISRILGLCPVNSDTVDDSYRKLSGMHLLVAEDNDLNWEIARELLGMYHITAVRAEHGQACLDMLNAAEAGYYDAVLMDIQMPVMNGYDAARAIRVHDRPDLRALPIVAMTADAYTEDVLRCIEAGMNAHVPKPIDMERLLAVLGELKK